MGTQSWICRDSWHLPHPGPSSHWTLHPAESCFFPLLSLRSLDRERGRCGARPLDNGNAGDYILPSPLPSLSFPVPLQQVKGAHGAASE